MCKCKILEAANVDAYLFDNMVIEELAIQDVVKAVSYTHLTLPTNREV